MPLNRCETCKTVTVYDRCHIVGHGKTRPLTDAETRAYVEHGHEAFPDIKATKDANGGILSYEIVR